VKKVGIGVRWSGIRLLWLAALALSGFMASCGGGGGGQYAFAQGAPAALPYGTFYSPETNLEKLDVGALGSAGAGIDLAAFCLSDKAIIAALADRAAHGVQVRIYLDRGELQAQCRGDALCARSPLHSLIGLPGVQIKVKNSKVLMHLKSYAVDTSDAKGFHRYLVRDGSANFSEQGEMRQDNSAVFTLGTHEDTVFETKFQAMWGRPDNLTVAGAVGGS
jgi:phosphatidylserine/phosphatidylglycerophosphate/cardiolipin synthase-like enzyme